ncbi:hypothetical protein DAMA08_042510 [Martiniozyma asiatica (nom. inval.)]|nr:hypothetical protein DAMA08_042510 [Martiniozyma asiatica]
MATPQTPQRDRTIIWTTPIRNRVLLTPTRNREKRRYDPIEDLRVLGELFALVKKKRIELTTTTTTSESIDESEDEAIGRNSISNAQTNESRLSMASSLNSDIVESKQYKVASFLGKDLGGFRLSSSSEASFSDLSVVDETHQLKTFTNTPNNVQSFMKPGLVSDEITEMSDLDVDNGKEFDVNEQKDDEQEDDESEIEAVVDDEDQHMDNDIVSDTDTLEAEDNLTEIEEEIHIDSEPNTLLEQLDIDNDDQLPSMDTNEQQDFDFPDFDLNEPAYGSVTQKPSPLQSQSPQRQSESPQLPSSPENPLHRLSIASHSTSLAIPEAMIESDAENDISFDLSKELHLHSLGLDDNDYSLIDKEAFVTKRKKPQLNISLPKTTRKPKKPQFTNGQIKKLIGSLPFPNNKQLAEITINDNVINFFNTLTEKFIDQQITDMNALAINEERKSIGIKQVEMVMANNRLSRQDARLDVMDDEIGLACKVWDLEIVKELEGVWRKRRVINKVVHLDNIEMSKAHDNLSTKLRRHTNELKHYESDSSDIDEMAAGSKANINQRITEIDQIANVTINEDDEVDLDELERLESLGGGIGLAIEGSDDDEEDFSIPYAEEEEE